jgi:hypothetical protein
MDNILFYMIAGFAAQMINTSLGMAYGVLCNSLLLLTGLTPVAASASVHTAELFGTAASGFCHWRHGNVDKKIFGTLVVPGIIGGALGAVLLTRIPAETIKPLVSMFLLLMGLRIIWSIVRNNVKISPDAKVSPTLGLIAGFLDAIGGGGWGSISTSHLVATGHDPRLVIGSVNAARFFVTIVSSLIFFMTCGFSNLPIVVGLAIGSIIAAPIAAPFSKNVKPRALTIAVAVLIVGLSLTNIWQSNRNSRLASHQVAAAKAIWR